MRSVLGLILTPESLCHEVRHDGFLGKLCVAEVSQKRRVHQAVRLVGVSPFYLADEPHRTEYTLLQILRTNGSLLGVRLGVLPLKIFRYVCPVVTHAHLL